MSSVKGSCHCKAIEFELDLPTVSCSHCHCETCRRLHGSAFVTWTSVPARQFRIIKGQGGLKTFETSPGNQWKFCGSCGTSLLNLHIKTPENVYVTMASLHGEIDREPKAHYSYEERVSWLDIHDYLPKYRGKTNETIES